MTDPKTLTDAEKMALGAQAKAILDNPAYKLAVEKVEKAMFEAWKSSNPEESEGRERLYQHVHVLRSLTAALNEILGDGMVAREKTLSSAAIQRAKGRRAV